MAGDPGHARELADDQQHALEHNAAVAVSEHLLDERGLEATRLRPVIRLSYLRRADTLARSEAATSQNRRKN
jgi:hypothetical protein